MLSINTNTTQAIYLNYYHSHYSTLCNNWNLLLRYQVSFQYLQHNYILSPSTAPPLDYLLTPSLLASESLLQIHVSIHLYFLIFHSPFLTSFHFSIQLLNFITKFFNNIHVLQTCDKFWSVSLCKHSIPTKSSNTLLSIFFAISDSMASISLSSLSY